MKGHVQLLILKSYMHYSYLRSSFDSSELVIYEITGRLLFGYYLTGWAPKIIYPSPRLAAYWFHMSGSGLVLRSSFVSSASSDESSSL